MATHLRLASNMLAPWVSIHTNDTKDCYGIQCNLIKYLARSLNFTFELIEEQGHGHRMRNGTWRGMVARFFKNVGNLSCFLDKFK